MPFQIMYIDDSSDNHKLFDRLIRRNTEIEIHHSLDIKEISELSSIISGIEILIADRNMPGLDGPQILEAAKRIKPELITVITSAYTSIATNVDNEKPVDLVLERPWTKKGIEEMVNQATALKK